MAKYAVVARVKAVVTILCVLSLLPGCKIDAAVVAMYIVTYAATLTQICALRVRCSYKTSRARRAIVPVRH